MHMCKELYVLVVNAILFLFILAPASLGFALAKNIPKICKASACDVLVSKFRSLLQKCLVSLNAGVPGDIFYSWIMCWFVSLNAIVKLLWSFSQVMHSSIA